VKGRGQGGETLFVFRRVLWCARFCLRFLVLSKCIYNVVGWQVCTQAHNSNHRDDQCRRARLLGEMSIISGRLIRH
jgi:hypothetical protein